MPLESVSAEDVLARDKQNAARAYPNPKRDPERLLPFADVQNTPAFQFKPDAKIFTIGSCFARNIERSLVRSGYHVTSSAEDFYDPFPDKASFQRYNKYTIPSIENEIAWALGERKMDTDALLVPVKDDMWSDLQSAGEGFRAPLDEMRKFRESFNSKFAPVAEADVVILTLGLVECWYDTHAQVYLNCFPGMITIRNNPGRFVLHVLDYDEVYQSLQNTHAMIARHNPDFQMLVTVSPVPLDRTFRPQDVLVANTYSKSVQRAAVEAFVANSDADYYPSYETVTLTDTKYAFGASDFRHVRGDIIDRIMGRVLEQYTDTSEVQSSLKAAGYISAYLNAGDLTQATKTLGAHTDTYGLTTGVMPLAAELAFRTGDIDTASETARQLIAAVDADPDAADIALQGQAKPARLAAGKLLEQCHRLQAQAGTNASADMEKLRAQGIVAALRKAAPEDPDIAWLQDYFDRTATAKSDTHIDPQDAAFLIEVAALSRFRVANRKGDVAGAAKIAEDAIAELGFNETIQWELAMMYRHHEHFAESFDAFVKIGQFGGAKAVQAVRNAQRLAHQLGKEDALADLAETVAAGRQS